MVSFQRILWPTHTTTGTKSLRRGKKIIITTHTLQSDLNLTQLVKTPTKIAGNTLDLIFTNNEDFINQQIITPTLRSTADHFIKEISTTYKTASPLQTTSPKAKLDGVVRNKYKASKHWLDWPILYMKHHYRNAESLLSELRNCLHHVRHWKEVIWKEENVFSTRSININALSK